MAFTDQQQQALKAKLRYRHVRTRASNGTPISYVEGWHVIAEANRIFGYDCWDRQTLSPRCLWRETERGATTCFYTAKVRITVRAGEATIVREGIGAGTGRSSAAETAHEIALKAAETDATKRALATFGNPFGLALHDKEQRGVTRRHRHEADADRTIALRPTRAFELHSDDTHGALRERGGFRRGDARSGANPGHREIGLRFMGSQPRQLYGIAARGSARR